MKKHMWMIAAALALALGAMTPMIAGAEDAPQAATPQEQAHQQAI